MVAEISPGVFKCERVNCQETVSAENPNSKRSRKEAERVARAHEARDAIHTVILDLSTLPPNPNVPNAPRTGFVVALATTEGLKPLSTKILGREQVEVDASVIMHVLEWGDYNRERKGRRRLSTPGSIADTQQRRDNLRLIHGLLEPPVLTK